MARGKRRKPLLPQASSLFEEAVEVGASDEEGLEDEINDANKFVEHRHKRMLSRITEEDIDSEDSGDEPEQMEQDVLNIDDSDSEQDSDEDSDDENDPMKEEREDRVGWGDKKKAWYGADTNEYEIMDEEEREEALKEEEEEALRLQKKAVSQTVAEDYQDDTDAEDVEDSDATESQKESIAHDHKKDIEETAKDVLEVSAPEVAILLNELAESRKQMDSWKKKVHWNETARIIYHLHASFVTNVAYYFSLRTDPTAEGIDIRTHPVIMRIVKIRNLLRKAIQLPCTEPEKKTKKDSLSTQVVENGDAPSENKEINKNSTGKRKKKDKKKRKKKSSSAHKDSPDQIQLSDDENRVQALLANNDTDKQVAPDDRSKKRRKLNQIVGAMEREKKEMETKRVQSADVDYIRDKEKKEKMQHVGSDAFSFPQEDDDEEVMSRMLSGKTKKQEREEKKAATAKPHVYRFKDNVDPESRRVASSQVVKNRGLTRYRPREKKTPRTKNRLAYDKAVVRRKGAVRDYVGKPGTSYSGEASGINISARKGSKLSNV